MKKIAASLEEHETILAIDQAPSSFEVAREELETPGAAHGPPAN